jgi:hypothetical protein
MPERRAAVERLLVERMKDPTLEDDQRTDVALVAVALDNLTPSAAAAVGAVLAGAMSKTTDANALGSLARGLSAVAARLEPKDAATVLAGAMSKTTDANALGHLAQGLSAVAARMGPKEAAEVAPVLIEGIDFTRNKHKMAL